MLRDTWAPDASRRGIPLSAPLSLPGLLSSDVEVAAWAGEGLPGDELSVQNGLLTTRATRWPLCIDPQVCVRGGACAFLVTMHHAICMKCVRLRSAGAQSEGWSQGWQLAHKRYIGSWPTHM